MRIIRGLNLLSFPWKISFSLKLLSGHFYGQSFFKTGQGLLISAASTWLYTLRQLKYRARLSLRGSHNDTYNIAFLLSVKAVTYIFISGRGSANSSAKQGKSGSIYYLVEI